MVVTWQNNPFLQPQRPPGFVSPEDFGNEQPPMFPNGTVGGVGSPDQPAQVAPMFTPVDINGGGMFGEGGQTPTGQPEGEQGDFPSASSIERRRKLAEALMGKQQEVNHPMQAVANAVSQIAGAWMDKRADEDQAKIEERRRKVVQGGFETSGGDFDKMMDDWMKSGDPELVDKALDYRLRKAAAAADGGNAPTTRNFYEGNAVVTKQWNPETKTWETVGAPSPRWKGEGSGGGAEDPNWDADGVDTPAGEADPTVPGTPASAPVDPSERSFKTPGPIGKRGLQQGPTIEGPDGQPISTVFNPNDGQLYYQTPDGLYKRAGGKAPAPKQMTPTQYVKLQQDYQNEINGMDALNEYFATVKDLPTGINRWALDVTSKAKQIAFGGKTLTPAEFNMLSADNQVQALLGLFRTTIVGPGVMTEYDAVRVLKALGGDPGSALQNPEVMRKILGDLYQRKQRQAQIYYNEYVRQARARGETPPPFGAPITLGGEKPGEEGGAPGKPPSPSASSGPKPKVVLPPKEKRIIGKTEYTAPDGNTFVWGRDSSGKVGWMPK
jgi:hypothetical protein